MNLRIFIAFTSLLAIIACNSKKEDPGVVQKRQQEEHYRENLKKLDSLKAMIRNGDLVTRSSDSWDSEQIKEFQQKDKTYTHAGIVKLTGKGAVICHIMAKDSVYKTDYTIYENIDSFLNPRIYTGFGLFRFNLDSSQTTQVVNYMDECYNKKVKFDYLFNNQDDTAMYCTEMISKGISKATGGKITFTVTPITQRRHINQIKRYYRKYRVTDKDLIGRPIYAIDDITTNSACKNIRRFVMQH